MATFTSPDRWNKYSKESDARSTKLKKEVEEGKAAQRATAVLGTQSKKGKDEYAAISSLLNMKESEAEDLKQRALDQYPKGTKSDGLTSRNRAEYGKPVDLPDANNKKKSNDKENKKESNNYAKGGYVNCGASVPATQKGKK